jgi:uncharacterized membrane protein
MLTISSTVQYLVTMLIIFAIDSVWLFTVGQWGLKVAKDIQGFPVRFRIIPALIVYIALAYLLLQANTLWNAVGVGIATYTVYDFTSLAILEKYDWRLAVADAIWGGMLFGSSWKLLNYFGWL